MSVVRVKICGVTGVEDARAAVRLGADALGLNLWPRSKRFVSAETARLLVRQLPPLVTIVGVFVDPTRDEVLRAIDAVGIQVAQLHGDESPELCASLPLPVVKAIRVKDSHSLAALASYEVSAFLLDSATPAYGGSGVAFDWGLAAEAAASLPVILAGGLTPENVADAVRAVRPLGVDVASGVESAPGVKDAQKMERFIHNAKEALR
jgi:phosphoribosylanthranilate isomerase